MSSLIKGFLLFLFSFLVVSLGNPIYVSSLSFFAAAIGYALIWQALTFVSSKKKRFFYAALWYALVQSVQLYWMTSREFQGSYILYVYAGICVALGLQFGLISLFLPEKKEQMQAIKTPQILFIASFWTLMEWARLYFLCGFSLHTSGMALAGSIYSMQMAAIFGVLGLSFWVILVNLFGLKWLSSSFSPAKLKNICIWIVLALIPYAFGYGHIHYHTKYGNSPSSSETMSVALVQTGLLPSQKTPLYGHLQDYVSPWQQWKAILGYLKEKKEDRWDLIVLPESAVPFRCSQTIYPLVTVSQVLQEELGQETIEYFPPLQMPYAEMKNIEGKEQWMVSNAFWSQVISNYFDAQVIIGMDEQDVDAKKNFNAAFQFQPQTSLVERYEKQVLVPLAEYLPFAWLTPLVRYYGITDFFTPGTGPKIFDGKIPISPSICYEETFSDIIREGRRKGALLFVNVTNDNWYPHSLLPLHHFEQGRLRAIENGVPLVRSCNSGVTAVVDSLGTIVCRLGDKKDFWEESGGALSTELPLYQYKTLYTIWGDGGIVALCLLFLTGFARFKNKFVW